MYAADYGSTYPDAVVGTAHISLGKLQKLIPSIIVEVVKTDA